MPKATKKADKSAEKPNFDEIKAKLVEQAKKDGNIAQKDINTALSERS